MSGEVERTCDNSCRSPKLPWQQSLGHWFGFGGEGCGPRDRAPGRSRRALFLFSLQVKRSFVVSGKYLAVRGGPRTLEGDTATGHRRRTPPRRGRGRAHQPHSHVEHRLRGRAGGCPKLRSGGMVVETRCTELNWGRATGSHGPVRGPTFSLSRRMIRAWHGSRWSVAAPPRSSRDTATTGGGERRAYWEPTDADPEVCFMTGSRFLTRTVGRRGAAVEGRRLGKVVEVRWCRNR